MNEHSDKYRICEINSLHIADLIRIGDATGLSPWSSRSYVEELKNSDAIMLRLVSPQNQCIGFVVGRCVLGGAIETRVDAEIYNIAVIGDEQGKGLGQALLDAFQIECIKRDVRNIWLEVRESNQRAIRFYERNGFERVTTRKHFYNDPVENAILMRLELE